MLNLDLDNLPRAVRAMKCQALAGELAKLRAEIATMRRGGEGADLARINILLRGVDELEKALTEATGTPEQRALEAAQARIEGSLTEALLDRGGAVKGRWEFYSKQLAELRLPNTEPSPYTSEAEEKLARVRFALTLPIVETARLVEIHKILGDA